MAFGPVYTIKFVTTVTGHVTYDTTRLALAEFGEVTQTELEGVEGGEFCSDHGQEGFFAESDVDEHQLPKESESRKYWGQRVRRSEHAGQWASQRKGCGKQSPLC
jgi:hypothetical protein